MNNRELNMNELAMVNGGIRVKTHKETLDECPNVNDKNGIPRGGRVKVRV